MGLIWYLYSLPVVKEKKIALLSNNICQDPLEQFFGCQQQRGGTSDNPNVLEFSQNTQALRVVDSFYHGPVRSNCRKQTNAHIPTDMEKTIMSLLKRAKNKKT